MNSFDVIRNAADRVGVKQVASHMKLSTSLIYKWCQSPRDDQDGEASGTVNPLDRMAALWDCTNDLALIDWICQRAGGTFVPNVLAGLDVNVEYVHRVQEMIKSFSELLNAASQSMLDDGRIGDDEAARIRGEWQELKQDAESFVLACEKGLFHDPRKP